MPEASMRDSEFKKRVLAGRAESGVILAGKEIEATLALIERLKITNEEWEIVFNDIVEELFKGRILREEEKNEILIKKVKKIRGTIDDIPNPEKPN